MDFRSLRSRLTEVFQRGGQSGEPPGSQAGPVQEHRPLFLSPDGTTEKRIPHLDGLRGVAILLVIVGHYFGELPHGLGLFATAWVGVDLFFVLSGYLIGGILIRNRSSQSFFSTFYIRRFFRIIPVYYLTLALVLIFITTGFFSFNTWSRDTLPIATYFTFTQNIYMSYLGSLDTNWLLLTWTLAVEEQFYLILPLIVRFTSEKVLLRVVFGLILFAPILRILLLFSDKMYEIAVLVLLPCRWDLLFFGVLAAMIQRNEHLGAILLSRNALPLKAIVLSSAWSVFFLLFADKHSGIPFRDTVGMIPLGLCFASYILLITRDAREGKFLCSKFLRFFGRISYALYLIHQPVSGLLHGLILGTSPDIGTIPQILVSLLALGLSVLLSWISWTWFESRLVAFGHRWQYNAAAPALQTTAPELQPAISERLPGS